MISLDILYEDNHLLIVNKPPGMLVQGDITGDVPLIEHAKNYIGKKYNKPGKVFLGLVHRLDRPTSGAVVFARTSKALTRLNALFANRDVSKTYWAVVKNAPSSAEGTLVHWLHRNALKNKSVAYLKAPLPPHKDFKKAILHYKLIKKLESYYLLEITLETGRHHQIRTQLAAINCPIKGDLKYGFSRSNPDGSIHLHARKLSFLHPVKKEIVAVEAPLPPKDAVWKACI